MSDIYEMIGGKKIRRFDGELPNPLPEVGEEDNGKVLGVVDGEWDTMEIAEPVVPTIESTSATGATTSVISSSDYQTLDLDTNQTELTVPANTILILNYVVEVPSSAPASLYTVACYWADDSQMGIISASNASKKSGERALIRATLWTNKANYERKIKVKFMNNSGSGMSIILRWQKILIS